MKKVNIGGDRLGSGNKMNVELHGFERSTHDLGYIWRSTMACGTLVPFMNIVGLPGDTFDINLSADIKTYPTVGPLFGSFKLQLDVFMCPVRLYMSKLHNNALGVGMDMKNVKLPLVDMEALGINLNGNVDYNIQQINPSSLLAYLGVRGLGRGKYKENRIRRRFNALPLLSYVDIFKNYYANKQEDEAFVVSSNKSKWILIDSFDNNGNITTYQYPHLAPMSIWQGGRFSITGDNLTIDNVEFYIESPSTGFFGMVKIKDVLENIDVQPTGISGDMKYTGIISEVKLTDNEKVELINFELKNIDLMREQLLSHNNITPYIINSLSLAPYNEVAIFGNSANTQTGLLVKTYQSDIFNNWLSDEWITGANGIAQVTAIDTSEGNFTIDTLNLATKVYKMLARVAVSGGTYKDWLEAVYDHNVYFQSEIPVYMGGMSQEVIFQQVVSQADTERDPLGSLAGRGSLADRKKGGNVTVKVNEPCIIMGIVSLTPRIDYSQGNDWSINLKTMDDFHKPSLDAIGFQDLITDKMAWWDTEYDSDGERLTFKSAGKQPAWLDYMTNFNKSYGEFANPKSEMYMTLNRRYELENGKIKDLTTYIDPAKFNYIFAVQDRSAQNFWTQLAVDVTARRKMSAKVIPNL